jgi:hypothetical protein
MRLALILFILVWCASAGIGLGQTSQPAAAGTASPDDAARSPMSWSQTVHALANALVNSGEGESLRAVLPAGTAIRRFDRLDPEDRLSLRESTVGGAVIMAIGYASRPDTIASDFSNAVQAAPFLPELIREQFALGGGPDDAKRANDIAAEWVYSTLQPGVEQPIGLIALWQERAPSTPGATPTSQIFFVLLKGELRGEQYHVTHVIYGDTTHILR